MAILRKIITASYCLYFCPTWMATTQLYRFTKYSREKELILLQYLGGPTPFLPMEKYVFFHFSPWEKMGKYTFFHGQKWGWTPPPQYLFKLSDFTSIVSFVVRRFNFLVRTAVKLSKPVVHQMVGPPVFQV